MGAILLGDIITKHKKDKYWIFLAEISGAKYVCVTVTDNNKEVNPEELFSVNSPYVVAVLFSVDELFKTMKKYYNARAWELLSARYAVSNERATINKFRDVIVLFMTANKLHDIAIRNFYLVQYPTLEVNFEKYFALFMYAVIKTYEYYLEQVTERTREDREFLARRKKIVKLSVLDDLKKLSKKLVEEIIVDDTNTNVENKSELLQIIKDLQKLYLTENVYINLEDIKKKLNKLFA